jgi:hypothetical protein
MIKFKKLVGLFTVAYWFCSFSAQALITPYIVETKTISFGNIIFIPGSCLMAYDTQVITNITSQNICINSSGTTGGYRVFANPNKQVQIKLNSHGDSGNGIIYVPDGQLVSDIANALIIADTTKTINSGTSGIIDITIGGRLTINSMLSSSSAYNELFTIEFTEL